MMQAPSGHSWSRPGRALAWFAISFGFFFTASPANGQTTQPFVFSATRFNGQPAIAVYTRNDATGTLTAVGGSPFSSKMPIFAMSLDVKGRFLFTVNNSAGSNISMFSVDSGTGALQEVPNSPFASTLTNTPMFATTDAAGQYLYVVDQYSSNAGQSLVESFQIDAVNLNLTPSSAPPYLLPGFYKSGAAQDGGLAFYIIEFASSIPNDPNGAILTTFHPANGTLTVDQPALGFDDPSPFALAANGQTLAIGGSPPQWGVVGALPISLPDGAVTETTNWKTVPIVQTSSVAIDPLGKFLYATFNSANNQSSSVHLFDAKSLVELPASPLPISFTSTAGLAMDPTSYFVYADQIYQIDPQAGTLTSVSPTSPLNGPSVFAYEPGTQPILGPSASFVPVSFSFGSITTGQSSTAQSLVITSTGGQALSVNSISLSGAKSGDFSFVGCVPPAVLQPGSFCTVLLTFVPSATGTRTASLTITDNGTPGTQVIPLSGTGLAPAPAVTIPSSVNFTTITQGTTATENVTVTNSGTLPLHISNIALEGANPGDFSFSTQTCTAANPVNSGCTITVTFAPLAAGVRTANLVLTHDAPNSPQTILQNGNATPAVTIASAPSGGSMTALVSAGQTAQYQLQATPGAGFNGTLNFACTGAPTGASCNVPSSVAVTNGAMANFTITVSTSGSSFVWPARPLPGVPLLPVGTVGRVLLSLLAAWLLSRMRSLRPASAERRSCHLALVTLVLVISLAGCGGAQNSVTPPPPVVTPSWTYTINVAPTATAAGSTKQLQLNPIQLTLTVK